MRLYNIYNVNYPPYSGNIASGINTGEQNTSAEDFIRKETYTTWRFDEFGNIVYYKIDSKTGEVISKEVYKNPAKEIGNFGS